MLRVPSTPDPSGLSVVMTQEDFSEIRVRMTVMYRGWTNSMYVWFLQKRAQVLTEEQKKEKEALLKKEKAERLEASNTRKREMQDLEQRRRQNEKPSDLEQVHSCSQL